LGIRADGETRLSANIQDQEDEWIKFELPVDKSVANWRGNVFPDQKLAARKFTGVGFLRGDNNKPGPFKLEVESIKVKNPLPDLLSETLHFTAILRRKLKLIA
jgi:hypothetical protein